MADYQRSINKFGYKGINLRSPPDLMPEGRTPFLSNVVSNVVNGGLTSRDGIDPVGPDGVTTNAPVHSIKRLNDDLPESILAWTRFVGTGQFLYRAPTNTPAFVQIDSGYSGNPLSMVPYRPAQSPESWLYVFDSKKQQKYKTYSPAVNIGIVAPTVPPVSNLNKPLYTMVLEPINNTGWVASGSASTPTFVSRDVAGTTISYIVYDSGTTGMACIGATNSVDDYSWIVAGCAITVHLGDYTIVEQVFTGSYSTTILGVHYDVGTSGLCTIQPTNPVPGLQRNMLILINGNAVRVLSVTAGPDALYSFRCSTNFTAVAGNTLVGVPSFRAYTINAHAAGEELTQGALSTDITLPVNTSVTSGQVSAPMPLDLTVLGGRPLLNEDYMHVSLRFDKPQYVTEVHVMLDVDAATNDFTQNYYYYVARQGDFQQSASGNVTTIQSRLNALQNAIALNFQNASDTESTSNAQIPYPGQQIPQAGLPYSEQIATGDNAWFELTFKLSDLARSGTDMSRTLANVEAIGIYVATAQGSVNCQFSGWWVGGGYGPDCNFNSYGNQGIPIQYRYRYRSSATGAISNQSPATRIGEIVRRQSVHLTFTPSTDPQVDLVDVERFGGTNPDWHRVAFVSNSSGVYDDAVTEAAAAAGEPLELLMYQPWPVTDEPRTGTCNTYGTCVVKLTGTPFNANWVRGTEVQILNNTYTLRQVLSDTLLEVEENIGVNGTLLGVSYLIPEATIAGYSLPYAWLWPAENRIFSCGDSYNPGLLYFSQPDNPDCASDRGYIEVTSPSEPLLNGFLFEGICFVWSAQNLYRVDSTPGAVNPYTSYRLSGVPGLGAPWAFDASGSILVYLGQDGVYAYTGGATAQNLTDEDLYPLFPHSGGPGVPVMIGNQVLYPVNYANLNALRIALTDNDIYFNYQDSSGARPTLRFSLFSKGWTPYKYVYDATIHYQEEGVNNPVTLIGFVNGRVGQISLTGSQYDFTVNEISCSVLTPSMDTGDTRARKQFGDIMLDYTGQITQGVFYDNNLVTGVSGTVPALTTRNQTVIDLVAVPDDTDDAAVLHRNISMLLAWKASQATTLYEWQPSYLGRPADTTGRPTDWMDAGSLRYKFVHGVRIKADAYGTGKQVQVQYDGEMLGPVITLGGSGEQVRVYSFDTPFKAHMFRLVPLGDSPWSFFEADWIVNPEPESTSYWVTQPATWDMAGFLHSRELWLAYASPNAALVSLVVDGVVSTLNPFPANNRMQKVYVPTPPLKGKVWQLTGTGTALQIYERDTELRIKSWGSTEQYAIVRPFGDLTRTEGGARV